MAKFLTTVGNSYYIEQIIINSTDSLTLVTPYLKLSRNLIERLTDADKEGVKITLIYGKSELAKAEQEKLYSLRNIQILFCQNLHAKCYYNDSSMIITSMNLYEFSERNNREMGILLEKENDAEIFSCTLREVESIKNASLLEKSYSSDDANNLLPKLQIDPNYTDYWNFHLPSLSEALKAQYPDKEISFNNAIRVKCFPKAGVDLEVSGRIDLKFDMSLNYQSIKEANFLPLRDALPGIRFYWNYPQLNIYLEKSFKVEVNSTGLEQMTKKFLQIIETVHDQIKM